MIIRPMVRTDLPTVTDISIQSFSKDELINWLYPKREQYPDDFRRYQLILLRSRFFKLGSHCFVAVSEEGDEGWNGEPEIMGYAFYVREGTDEGADKWRQNSMADRLERYLIGWEQWYEGNVLSRVKDSAHAQVHLATTRFDPQISAYWHLGFFGTSPKYQRRGVGAKLVAHGQKLAAEDKLPITLKATVAGRFLYAKMGFLEIERHSIVEGLAMVSMIWEPEEAAGTWLVRREDGKASLKDL